METKQTQTLPVYMNESEWYKCTDILNLYTWDETQVLQKYRWENITISDLNGTGWQATQFFCKSKKELGL